MEYVRVLHTGDMHLGSEFCTLGPAKARRRKEELESTVLGIVEKSADYDIVLVTGDVFDSPYVDRRLADRFLSAVREKKKTRFFWSCGNHDPFYGEIVQYCLENKSDNLHIFSPEYLESVFLPGINVCVYGRSFAQNHENISFLKDFEGVSNKNCTNLLCMHTDFGESSGGVYNPVTVSELSSSGFDYAALGHVHSHRGFMYAGKTCFSYCGCPEGRGFDECQQKGYVSVIVSGNEISKEFVNCSQRIYVDDKIDITDMTSYRDIISLINDIAGSGNLCRIELVGINNISAFTDVDYIAENTDAFFVECIDSTRMAIEPETYADCVSLKGLCAMEASERIKNASSENEKNLIRKAFCLLCEELDKG